MLAMPLPLVPASRSYIRLLHRLLLRSAVSQRLRVLRVVDRPESLRLLGWGVEVLRTELSTYGSGQSGSVQSHAKLSSRGKPDWRLL